MCCTAEPIGEVLKGLGVRFERDVPLAPLTWYGLGGSARIVARPADRDQLASLLGACRARGVATYVLGRGANLLVLDRGVEGVVIRLDARAFGQVRIEGTRASVGAGCDLMKLVLRTAQAGLAGLECLAGIPATVGGALRMNAGGRHGEIGSVVVSAELMDLAGHVARVMRADLGLGYRTSAIGDRVVLDADLALARADPRRLRARVKAIFAEKRASQPLGAASAGCAFKNPAEVPAGLPSTAGALIDRAGLKGYRVGGAEVSQRHANFIVARHGASAADVVRVLEHVERTVRERFGVKLERELVIWP